MLRNWRGEVQRAQIVLQYLIEEQLRLAHHRILQRVVEEKAAADPTWAQRFDVSADRRFTGLERREHDQGQHDGIRDARFSVRTLEPDGEPGDWHSDWEQVGLVPRLVRLELEFAEPRARWPDFVAAPRLGQSPPPGAGASLLSPGSPVPLPETPGPVR